MFENVPDIRGMEIRENRHDDRPGPKDSEVRDRPLGPVLAEQGNPVARLDSPGDEQRRQAAGGLVEGGEGHGFAVHEGESRPVRKAFRTPAERIHERQPFETVDEGYRVLLFHVVLHFLLHSCTACRLIFLVVVISIGRSSTVVRDIRWYGCIRRFTSARMPSTRCSIRARSHRSPVRCSNVLK